MIGWEKMESKISKLNQLQEVGLSNCRIVGETEHLGISAVCPAIKDIDLSKNLFTDINQVAAICSGLEHLEILRLNYNRFSVLTPLLNKEAFKVFRF